jgi:hypothetical protein
MRKHINLQTAVLFDTGIESYEGSSKVRVDPPVLIPVAIVLVPVVCISDQTETISGALLHVPDEAPASVGFLHDQLRVVMIHFPSEELLHSINHLIGSCNYASHICTSTLWVSGAAADMRGRRADHCLAGSRARAYSFCHSRRWSRRSATQSPHLG